MKGGGNIRSIWERDRRRCHICGRGVALGDASRDHVEPRSLGGYDKAANYRLAHKACNTARGNLEMVVVALLRDELDRTMPRWKPIHLQVAMRDARAARDRRR